MVEPAWCDLLGSVKTEWNDHIGFLSPSIDAANFLRKAWKHLKMRNWRPYLAKSKKNLQTHQPIFHERHEKLFFDGQNILRRAELESLAPPAVFSRDCSCRLQVVSSDDSWPGWRALHFLWGMQKMGEFLNRGFFVRGIRMLPEKWALYQFYTIKLQTL